MVDGARKLVLNLVFFFLLYLVISALLDFEETLIIHPDTALVLQPQGDVVEEYSGTPLDFALQQATETSRAETRLRDLTEAVRRAADDERIVRLVTLPAGVHDARPWREGVLFNDTEAEVVRFLTPDANCVFPVPRYPEAALEPGSCADSAVARQGFARGLCVLGEGAFASGSSPLTITLHDLDTMKTTLRINLSTDLRHAIHTLAVWPFQAT